MNSVQHQTPTDLDAVFSALSDPTRRSILVQLKKGSASVAELNTSFDISQPAVSKHLRVLQTAGLVERNAHGQKRMAKLKAAPLSEAVGCLTEFRAFWEGSFDQLDALLDDLKDEKETRE